jgi:hypothetical protein
MKAIVNKTEEKWTVESFNNDGTVTLNNDETYNLSELTLDYDGELDEKTKIIRVSINSLIGNAIVIGNDAKLDEIENSLREILRDATSDGLSF